MKKRKKVVKKLAKKVKKAKKVEKVNVVEKDYKWLRRAARVLAIVFIIFISVFALDVFAEEYTFWQAIGALLIHLIPSFVLIFFLWVSWKWEHIGGALFILAGIFYIAATAGRAFTNAGAAALITYIIISGPAILIGIFFLLHWFKVKKKKK